MKTNYGNLYRAFFILFIAMMCLLAVISIRLLVIKSQGRTPEQDNKEKISNIKLFGKEIK